MQVSLVLLGGALGSVARYLVALWMANRFGSSFPWGTLTVNVVGSFLIGLIATVTDETGALGPNARLFVVVGVLGGFTTFSSFSLETMRLAQDNDSMRGLTNVAATLLLGLGAAALGIAVGRLWER